MILNEGGNIFQGTEPFDHKIIPAMMKQINSVTTKTGAKALPIGSGASPTPGKISGDLDMIIDAGALFKHFNVTTPKDARIELEKLFNKQDMKQSVAEQVSMLKQQQAKQHSKLT